MKDGTIATASRDIAAIKRRQFADLAFRGLRKAIRLIANNKVPNTAVLYPHVGSFATLSDLLNRAAWYLPADTLSDKCELYVNVSSNLDLEDALKLAPEAQEAYDSDHLPIQVVDQGDLDQTVDEAGLILLWDAKHLASLPTIKNVARVEIIDPKYYSSTEPNAWGRAGDVLRRKDSDRSTELYRKLEEKFAGCRRSFVFATGPSLDNAMSMDFDDSSLKVVCNSIVRNDEMIEHIDPDVLVFADPVFHFGPSKYAEQFRRDAVSTLRQYDCIGVIPPQHLSLMTGHYPDVDFVAIEGVGASEPNFPSHDDLWVMGTNNIMTLYMLPIASALSDEVNILGADGRKEDESYFWEHNDSAQYDDEMMKTAVECHPSFFRDRIYTDYYDGHVSTLKSMIEYGERQDISYYNLTHSYIPCLSKRSVENSPAHISAGQ